jgi:hypothetical protein
MFLNLTSLKAFVLSAWCLAVGWTEPENPVTQAESGDQAAYSFLLETPIDPLDRPNRLLGSQIIVLGHDFQGKAPEIAELRLGFEEQTAARNLDNSIVSIRDKQGESGVQRLADLVHAHFPGLQVAFEETFPSEALQEAVDLFIPLDASLSRNQVELWKDLKKLGDCVEAVRRRKHPKRYLELIGEAEELLHFWVEEGEDSNLRARDRLRSLVRRFEPLTKPVEKWDRGAMSLDRAAEVRVAEETARSRKELFQRHLDACRRLGMKPISEVEWKGLWPRRCLFSQDFEGSLTPARDWLGEIVTANVPPGSTRALAGIRDNKHFARRTRIGIYYDNARAAATTFVRFQYFINKPLPIGIFVFNMTQGDNWEYTIHEPVVGSWQDAFIEVSSQFRKKSGGSALVKTGDALDDVFIHAGSPGDTDLILIVDNVSLIGLDM